MEYVNHPRYGNKPIVSEYNFANSEIDDAYWRYKSIEYFRETAIPADITKQVDALYPRRIYVDIKESCRSCSRSFIFYALEQQYWFEVLSFYIDSHCVRCIDCRRQEREFKDVRRTYCELISKQERTAAETDTLKGIAEQLFELGLIKDRSKVDKIR